MITVSKETFEDEIIKSDVPVVIDFWGPQCVPCLSLMPKIKDLSDKYAGKIKIAKIEAPKNRRLCLDLRVAALPTFLFYKNGKEIDRYTGDSLSAETIDEAIQKMLG
jgi:thioredoxin 1